MSLSWKPLVVGLALTACAPSTTPPTQVMAIDVINHGVYAPTEVSLFAKDISALKGDAANFIGGSRIVIDPNDPLLPLATTPQQIADITLKQKGIDVRVNYLNRNGVLWPVDFHSWNMVTLYYNFERAYSYFNSLGLLDPVKELSGSTVYYFPDYFDGSPDIAQPAVDNLLWQPAILGFVILPFQDLQAIPLAMNRGAVAHEYSHRIWNIRVEGGLNFPAAQDWLGLFPPAFKIYESYNEGLADYHAVESLCLNGLGDPQCDDTRFLEASLGERAAIERDFKKDNNCLSADQIAALNTNATTGDTFFVLGLQYQVGTVIGASLYFPGKALNLHKAMQGALVASYDDPAKGGIRQLIEAKLASPGDVTLQAIADVIVRHITQQNLKAGVCAQFLDRLRLNNSVSTDHPTPDLPSCPASVAPAGVCLPL